MKNSIIYYSLILIPLGALVLLARTGSWNLEFTIGILAYGLLYRPITDFYRLKSRKPNSEVTLLKFFVIPLYSLKWFKTIYAV